MSQTGARLLVDCLAGQSVDRIFCVPGESYMSVLDALHDRNDIQTITCRHESGAGFMAVTDAKLTGRPGIVFASRGPGATNAAISLHQADQDAAPIILFIGHVPREDIGRGSFQEIDYGKFYGSVAKWVHTIHDPDRIPEVVARAFHIAASGTPGPVVIVLPEDMLDDAAEGEPVDAAPVAHTAPTVDEVEKIAAILAQAERPLLIAGGLLENGAGRLALRMAAEQLDLPVAASFRRQDVFPNQHSNWAGHLAYTAPKDYVELLKRADLVLAVGTRLNDATTQGYSFPKAPRPDQTLIHVYPDPNQISRIFATDRGLAADPIAFLETLIEIGIPHSGARSSWVRELNEFTLRKAEWRPSAQPDGIVWGTVVMSVARRLASDGVVIMDAGLQGSWVHRHFPFGANHTLIAALVGAMGIGMPSAVAAGLRLPGRQIVTFIGDGSYLMTGTELATAIQYGVPVKVFISNNSSYGTIRLNQEKAYPGRPIATDLVNPDFAMMARSFGAHAIKVERDEEVDAAVAEALAHDGPVVVEVKTSLRALSAYVTLEELAPV